MNNRDIYSGVVANAIEAHNQAQLCYAAMRRARKAGNMTLYRLNALRAKQMFAHYESYRDCATRLAQLATHTPR